MRIVIGGYKVVRLPVNDALRLLDVIEDMVGFTSDDLAEARRVFSRPKVFLDLMRRRQKEYLPLPHRVEDMIRGRIVLDKVGLRDTPNGIEAILVFDRRFELDRVVNALEELGYNVKVERETL